MFVPMPILDWKQRTKFHSMYWRGMGCWEWKGNFYKDGYGTIMFEYRRYRAHRIAYFLRTGIEPGELCSLHQCDNRACVNPQHLFLGTKQDNVQDAMNKGRHSIQLYPHPALKVSQSVITEMDGLRKSGWTLEKIADYFKIHNSTVWRLLHG